MDHVLYVTQIYGNNQLEFSHRFIALNNFSIPGGKSSEPQKDILDDDLLLLLLFPLSS
jgi:hypothetical protein